MTPLEKSIETGVRETPVQVHELTMSSMRGLLVARANMSDEQEHDPIEMLLLNDGLLLHDLVHLTDLEADELSNLTERDLSAIVAATKELNPRFFGQILGTMMRAARKTLDDDSQTSSAQSSSSSDSDIQTPGATH